MDEGASPILSPAVAATAAPLPTRPDETRLVFRGMRRHLFAHGWTCVEEVPLASGRRADIVAINHAGLIAIIEVKSSIEDFRTDQKWPDYRAHADWLFFATTPRVPQDIFPPDCGLYIADGYGAALIREAPEHRMPAATRKSLLVRLTRLASARLIGQIDPGATAGFADGT